MSRDDAPPFQRGSTYYNGDPIDLNNLTDEANLEGKEFVFEVNSTYDYGTPTFDPSGRLVRVRVVRNAASVNLLPGKVAKYATSGGFPYQTKVDSYTTALADLPAGVIDEFLPAAGVPPGDLFYLVVEGPSKVETVTTGTIALASGTPIVPTTGTSATSADSGCIVAQDLTGSAATLANNIQNRVGYSEGTQTSLSTLTPIVVRLGTR